MQGDHSTARNHSRTTDPVIMDVNGSASGQAPARENNEELELQRFSVLFEKRKDDISKVYRNPGELVYHGTTKGNKRLIQQYGFCKERKTDGATNAAGDVDGELSEVAAKYHYFSTKRAHAAEYAALAGQANNDGAIVTVFGRTKTLGLKTDRDSAKENQKIALRTNRDIPPGNVLPSKKNPDMSHSNAAIEHFQKQLKRKLNIEVPITVAASWLHDVQSDSEGDDDNIAMTKKIKIR